MHHHRADGHLPERRRAARLLDRHAHVLLVERALGCIEDDRGRLPCSWTGALGRDSLGAALCSSVPVDNRRSGIFAIALFGNRDGFVVAVTTGRSGFTAVFFDGHSSFFAMFSDRHSGIVAVIFSNRSGFAAVFFESRSGFAVASCFVVSFVCHAGHYTAASRRMTVAPAFMPSPQHAMADLPKAAFARF